MIGVFKAVGTVVGVISGIVGLVFVLWPDAKPAGEAPKETATLSDLSFEPNITFAQFLQRTDEPILDYSRRKLAERGAFLQFRVAIIGYEGKRLVLKWELFDRRGDQLDESKDRLITPTTSENEALQQFWVPLPRRNGRFVAVVQLLEQKKHSLLALDSLRTPAFRGLGRAAAA